MNSMAYSSAACHGNPDAEKEWRIKNQAHIF